MDDLTTRLLAAIEEADDVKEDDPSGHCDELEGRHYMADEVHRRCAADRKIVELHGVEARMGYEPDDDDTPHAYGSISRACKECGSSDLAVRSPCKTLLLLAEGYGITEETDHA